MTQSNVQYKVTGIVSCLLVACLAAPSVLAVGAPICSADLNNDGIVDHQDLLILRQQWLTEGVVPEQLPPDQRVQIEVTNVVIPQDLQPEVTFTLANDLGDPIPPQQLSRFSWTIARIVVDDLAAKRTRYKNYITRQVSGAFGIAHQATYDSGGQVIDLGNGAYTYKFGTTLQDYDPTLTHTVAGQIMLTVNDQVSIANPIHTFVPDGSPVTVTRDISSTESCNACHDPLAIHGGGRRDYTLCLVCHHPGQMDPDTGNSIDMGVMIHKIHRGAALPSVQDGTPYQIIGFRNSVHDYSNVHFPMDIRNCTVCHQDGSEADYYKEVPSIHTCGSCHDNVDFETGVGHGPGIALPDNSLCIFCHEPHGDEFDRSVVGAHTVPVKSTQLEGMNAEILEVQNAVPGSAPLVRFRLFKNNGDPHDISVGFGNVNIAIAGPTTDYTVYWTEAAVNAAVSEGDGVYAYQFNRAIDADASGTFAFSIEARGSNFQIVPGDPKSTVRESVFNPVHYVSLDDGAPTARRQVIDANKCYACHDQLSFHGVQRRNYDYCVMCHNPNTTDIRRRPGDKMPPESIDMRYMIHKIHAGVELENGYTAYGFGNVAHDYSDVHYVGDLRNCQGCHLPGTYFGSPPGSAPVVVRNSTGEIVSQLGATSAACLSCHDSDAAHAHALSALAAPDGAESCLVCHGQHRSSAVDKLHARPE